ncbi:oligopeptide transport system ATP-binding protein [Thermosporothrix hazakensis]|jgi:oligopeptide transport system ATP-binding protein|uniref:Oligopeptide transport system ATP-binding protein n=2 Tax=Thermosporothrix TaxID=768650 RepID=A0A326UA53_THEHA|nr:oligopeptide/dipeptide ABC transporter ATP-binding protein [Thermosporothrix hazakensis]PZW33056.1 oligopeptide transport system ATP-binding protein [Thermosporothrix hazakensis]BBH91036.1 ABC transporter ATP-binding protein [Thermosporothrix sp. COM3]GCE49088.1 ABC transporter ATP-binding protein [Thermosporothrix hazakensis]
MVQQVETQKQKAGTTLVEVKGLKVHFPIKGGLLNRTVASVKAVDGVDLFIRRGETLGLVGESGCGKSTTGRAILQLIKPSAGSVKLDGVELTKLPPSQIRQKRSEMQLIFQDPFGSLDPRYTIGQIVSEPLENFRRGNSRAIREEVAHLLETVGINPLYVNRYAHEFSGGQRQRIGIARALALRPSFVVADEPVSALDVSIQAQVLNLLQDLQAQFGLTYLFVAHNLSVVKHISDRVAVMYLGRVVELAKSEALYEAPLHPYTQALLSAVPVPNPEIESRRKRIILEGDVPSPVNPPSGCNFHPRCWKAQAICREQIPPLEEKQPNHYAACHFPG